MEPIDFTRYVWRRDEKVQTRFKRELGGGELIEDVWNFFKHGEQNLFLGLYISVAQQTDTTKFIDLLKSAWISTRWDIPTVAAQVLHEPREGSPMPAALLAYDAASSPSEVEKWAQGTIFLKHGYKDLDALRYDVGQEIIPTKDLEPQTFIYVLQFSSTQFGLLFRTSHAPFDGAGLKMVGTKVLDHLSQYISDPSYASRELSRTKWGSEGERLLPIASEILRQHEPAEIDAQGNVVKPELPAEPRSGPEYVATLTEILQGLAKGGPLSHPFQSLKQPPYDPAKEKPKTRRAFHTFTQDESKKIMAAGNISDKLTVNHIALGSLCLLTVLDNPPPQNSPNVVFLYGLVDSRNRLSKEYRGPDGYPGYCLGMSSIQVPVAIGDKYVASGGVESNKKAAIFDFAKAVKEEYKRQSTFPALLAVENQQVEMMLGAPPPPPFCGPWFAGDGRGAIYLRPKYPESGPPVVEVTDFFVGLNKTDPGPFFRATEWNGRIMLSADFNELAVEPSVVNGWMKKWAELILAAAA